MTQKDSLAEELLTITGQITMDRPSSSFFKQLSKATVGCKVSTPNRLLKLSFLVFSNFSICFQIADPENCLVIHCNSGKGRTGTAICALLLFMGYFSNVDDCLKFYGHQRFICGKGVSQPCQLRYLYYFEAFFRNKIKSPCAKRLRGV